MKISEFLFTGAENARSGRELCAALNISQRELTLVIERERRAGEPICASTDANRPGYYLAANKEELMRFCNSLFHRAGEISKTREACLAVIECLPDGEAV